MQLKVSGLFNSTEKPYLDDRVPDDYSINWDGLVPSQQPEDDVNVPGTNLPLCEQQLNDVKRLVDQKRVLFSNTAAME